jgi:hypothetical protein
VVAAALTVRRLRRPRDPADIERRRCTYISRVGRIAEGHILDLVEAPPEPVAPPGFVLFRTKPRKTDDGHRRLICYSYSISGVSYETAQDVTGLELRLGLDRLAPGQPARVKYDPANPGNSILIADDWSGLH